MSAHSRKCSALVALTLASGVVASPAQATDQPLDTGFEWASDVPEISIVDVDLNGATACVVSVSGTGTISKSVGAATIVESGSVRAKSSCRTQRLVASVAITDGVAGGVQPSYSVSSFGSGSGGASTSASQSVDYSARPLSTVVFRYKVSGSTVSQCWEHRFTVIGGLQAIDNGVAACE